MSSPRSASKSEAAEQLLSARQFNEIAAMVATMDDPETLKEKILHFVKDQLQADRVALFSLLDEGAIELEGALGADREEIEDMTEFSRGILEGALENRNLTRIPDAQKDARLARRVSVKRLNIRSVLAAPLIRQRHTVGLLYADTLDVPGTFVESDQDLLRGIAHLLAAALEQSWRMRDLATRSGAPRRPGSGRLHFPGVVADSRKLQRLLRLAMKVARTDKTILIAGEPGTGKELIADVIQQHSRRAKLPYLKLNCAAIPESGLESELFGVAAGAFTGVVAREGLLELADGGTLFLDEISELSLSAQGKLLRVLEDRLVQRVGGKRLLTVNVRLIAATDADLAHAVQAGRFRRDLYERLNQFSLQTAPLREHREDIPGLAAHFLELERQREGIERPIEFVPEVLDWLIESPLPGNARELANMVGKMVALDTDGQLDWDDLPPDLKAIRVLQSPKFDSDSTFDNLMANAEAAILKRALDNAEGRIRKAARDLSMPEATLRRRLKMLSLHLPTKVQMNRYAMHK